MSFNAGLLKIKIANGHLDYILELINQKKYKELADNSRNLFHVIFILPTKNSDDLMKMLLNQPKKLPRSRLSKWINQSSSSSSSIDYCNTSLACGIANEQKKRVLWFLELTQKNKILIHPAIDSEMKTQLTFAAKCYQENIALAILQTIPMTMQYLNLPDQDRRTAFHYACLFGMKKLRTALLARGVNIKLRDKFGCTGSDYDNNIDVKVISEVLRSVDIEPTRAYNAASNKLRSQNSQILCYACVNKKNKISFGELYSKGTKSTNLVSTKSTQTNDMVKNLLDPSIVFVDGIKFYAKTEGGFKNIDKKYRVKDFELSWAKREELAKQFENLSKESLVESIIRKKEEMMQDKKMENNQNQQTGFFNSKNKFSYLIKMAEILTGKKAELEERNKECVIKFKIEVSKKDFDLKKPARLFNSFIRDLKKDSYFASLKKGKDCSHGFMEQGGKYYYVFWIKNLSHFDKEIRDMQNRHIENIKGHSENILPGCQNCIM